MDPRDFDANLTRASGDGGDDLEVRARTGPLKTVMDGPVLIQCKRYQGNVSADPVQQLAGVVATRKALKGVLVTSGGFTKDARNFAATNPQIQLIDREALTKLLQEHRLD